MENETDDDTYSRIGSVTALLGAIELQAALALAERALKASAADSATQNDVPRQGTLAPSAALSLIAAWVRRWESAAANSGQQRARLNAVRSLMALRARAELGLARAPAAEPVTTVHSAGVGLGCYIQMSYELVAGRAARAAEIESWLNWIDSGRADVAAMLSGLMREAADHPQAMERIMLHIGDACWVMGTDRHLTMAQWQAQAQSRPGPSAVTAAASNRYRHRFAIARKPRPLVSALLSLWRGGDHIRRFMDNITAQDGFAEYCELLIVDADSPDSELDVIQPFLDKFKNIRYVRCDRRIGIYDAWNLAIGMAQGDHLTTTNVDDLRRHDSLMLQAGVLEHLPYVDVVYQDFLYTLDPALSFEEIQAFGHVTALPAITPHSLLQFNPPHNAPMWRRGLHAELGLFDTAYQSAADYEFWLRCLAAGKAFYKLNDPHVAYYQNPNGISTSQTSRGPEEARQIGKAYARRLIPSDVTVSDEEFANRLGRRFKDAERPSVRQRYALAQRALRDAARLSKYALVMAAP